MTGTCRMCGAGLGAGRKKFCTPGCYRRAHTPQKMAWAARNPVAVAASRERNRERHNRAKNEADKIRRAADPEWRRRVNANSAASYRRHRAKKLAWGRWYAKVSGRAAKLRERWRSDPEHRAHRLAYGAEWCRKNPEKRTASWRRGNARAAARLTDAYVAHAMRSRVDDESPTVIAAYRELLLETRQLKQLTRITKEK